MDVSGLALDDVAPLMHSLEDALADRKVQRVMFRDDCTHGYYAELTRAQAELLLKDLEQHFFAVAN